MSASQRQDLLNHIEQSDISYKEIEKIAADMNSFILKDAKTLDRQAFILMPVEIERELILSWLRNLKVEDIDRQTIERLIVKIKTAKAGTKHNIKKNVCLSLTANSAQISNTL